MPSVVETTRDHVRSRDDDLYVAMLPSLCAIVDRLLEQRLAAATARADHVSSLFFFTLSYQAIAFARIVLVVRLSDNVALKWRCCDGTNKQPRHRR